MESLLHQWQSVGHEQTQRLLSAQLAAGTVAHAYLFSGPTGVGKTSLAAEFAEKIVGSNYRHNITVYDTTTSGSIEEVRALLQAAALTPLTGNKKVVIIKHVHTISTAAASAMLKTLEEPNGNTTFLLLSDTDQVLSTIISRCQKIKCNRLSSAELRAAAIAQGIVATDEMIVLAAGSISKLKARAGNDEYSKAVVVNIEIIQKEISLGDFERMQLVQSLATLDPPMLLEVIEGWMHLQTAALKNDPKRFTVVKTALETLHRLQKNFNKKMVLEYFVTNTAL